jgi:signal transduction histidine kinase
VAGCKLAFETLRKVAATRLGGRRNERRSGRGRVRGLLMLLLMRQPLSNSPHDPRKSGPEASSSLRFSDLVCSVAFAALLALSVGLCGAGVTPWGNDASGVLFLLIAFVYRGSRRAWWFFWAPASLLMLFAPVFQWERTDLLVLGTALRASLLPGLGFVAGSLIAGVRDTLQLSIEGSEELQTLQARTIANRFELRRLGYQVRLMIDALATAQFGGPLPKLQDSLPKPLQESSLSSLPEPSPAANRDHSYRSINTEAMSHVEIHGIIAEEVTRLAERMKMLRLSARIRFQSSTESPVPLAVRGRPEILRTLVRDLLSVAADSLLKGEGMLTVILRPGLRNVSFTIEDNGRGLNEAMLVKLEDKGLATRSPRLSVREIRSLSEAVGWSLAIQGRLGVGSRISLELPRVDTLAVEMSDVSRTLARPPNLRVDGLNDTRVAMSAVPLKLQ